MFNLNILMSVIKLLNIKNKPTYTVQKIFQLLFNVNDSYY